MNAFWTKLGAIVAGALYVTLWLKVAETPPNGTASVAALQLALAFAVLFLAVAALASLSEWGSKINIWFFVVGAAIGVVRDALTDTKNDRNLFPIEVVFWCALFAMAMGFGKELGAWWKKKAKRSVEEER
jgi:hypothetical protein